MQALKEFEYLEPGTIDEASRISTSYGNKAKVLAGGLSLVDCMKRRVIEPECVLNIQRVPGLNYVRGDGKKGLKIGALASLRDVELYPAIEKDYLLLYEAVHQIASVQVKTMGTLVGNLCVGTPASDIAPALLVLGAKLEITSFAAKRVIPIEGFFIGVNRTVLQPGELVTAVSMPGPAAGTGGAFLKIARAAADLAKVNVAVVVTVKDGKCTDARIALGSVAPTTIRAKKAESILKGQKLEMKAIQAAAQAAADEIRPITDVRSTAEYRREITRVLVTRAIAKALERAKV